MLHLFAFLGVSFVRKIISPQHFIGPFRATTSMQDLSSIYIAFVHTQSKKDTVRAGLISRGTSGD